VREATADQIADPAPAKAPPGKKDRWAHCKQSPDGQHELAFIFRQHMYHKSTECGWVPRWWRNETPEVYWACYHQEECKFCGKISRSRIAREECPNWPGTVEQQAAAQAKAREWAERAITNPPKFRRAKRAVLGKQGYRRPKGGKK
jgi:hypothetical protein